MTIFRFLKSGVRKLAISNTPKEAKWVHLIQVEVCAGGGPWGGRQARRLMFRRLVRRRLFRVAVSAVRGLVRRLEVTFRRLARHLLSRVVLVR